MKSSSAPDVPMGLARESAERTKGLIGVGAAGRPLLDYQLWNARAAGIRDITIVTGEQDRMMREFYGERDRGNPFHGLTISYALQLIPAGRKKPLGTADALLCALRARTDWRESHFIVCNSDNLYSVRAIRLLRSLPGQGGMIEYDVAGLHYNEDRIAQFGVTRKNRDGFLTAVIEKPEPAELAKIRTAEGTIHVSMNIWRLSYLLVLPYLEQCPLHPVRLEKELPEAIHRMIQDHPDSLVAVPLSEHVPDLTYKQDITAMQQYLHENFGELDWR